MTTGTSTRSRPHDFIQKDERARLFKTSKPVIRATTREDMIWVRVSYKQQGIEMTDEEFSTLIAESFGSYDEVLIIEDNNARFGAAFGPIGIVAAHGNGHVYEPHAEWFPWATPRNILRGSVAFFQKFRYRKIGVVIVHSLDNSAVFFRRLKRYVPLNYVGKIPDGDPAGRGNDYIFSQRCKHARYI